MKFSHILPYVSIIASLLPMFFSYRIMKFRVQHGVGSGFHMPSDPEGPFDHYFDQEIADNTTIYDPHELEYNGQTRIFLKELIEKHYFYPFLVFATAIVHVSALTIDHVRNLYKKEQNYLLTMMWSSPAIGLLGLFGLLNGIYHTGLTEKNVDVIIFAVMQLYSGAVVLCFWNFVLCSDPGITVEAPTVPHHFLKFDFQHILPQRVKFDAAKVTWVSKILNAYIPIRLVVVILCTLVLQFVAEGKHFVLELMLDVILLCYEIFSHYWLHLFYEAVRQRPVAPLIQNVFCYVKLLGFFVTIQDWILKIICFVLYMTGFGKILTSSDCPIFLNILLILESLYLVALMCDRFSTGAYFNFLLAVSKKD